MEEVGNRKNIVIAGQDRDREVRLTIANTRNTRHRHENVRVTDLDRETGHDVDHVTDLDHATGLDPVIVHDGDHVTDLNHVISRGGDHVTDLEALMIKLLCRRRKT